MLLRIAVVVAATAVAMLLAEALSGTLREIASRGSGEMVGET